MPGPRHLALAVLLAGLLTAAGLSRWQQLNIAADTQGETQRLADDLVTRVATRLERAELALRAARGPFLGAAPGSVGASRFGTLHASLDLAREVPGLMGLGLLVRVPVANEGAYVRAMRQQGQDAFAVRTLVPHEGDRWIVQHVEPLQANLAALGLDMGSEPARRAAVTRAWSSDTATLTAPVRLVQSRPGSSLGMVMLLPLRASPPVPQATGAMVYGALQADTLFGAINLHQDLVQVDVSDVTDASAPGIDLALPATGDSLPDAVQVSLRRNLYGRDWLFKVRARPALVAAQHHLKPSTVLLLGLLGSVVASALAWSLASLRLRTQAALDERTRLRSMMDRASDAIVGLDLSGQVTIWNNAAEQLFGFAAAQALGQPLTSLTAAPGQVEEDRRLLDNARAGLPTPPFEARRMHLDGTLLDVEISGGPMQDASGTTVGLVKIVRPIAAHLAQVRGLKAYGDELAAQVAERTTALEQVSRDLRTVLDALPSMVGSWDRHLVNRFANRAYSGYFSKRPEEIVGHHVADLLGPVLFEKNRPYMEAALRGEPQTFEREVPLPNGGGVRHTLAHYIPQRDGDGDEVLGFYVLVHDLTEVRESRRRLASIVEATQVGTWEWHAPSGALRVNERWVAMLGYTLTELRPLSHDTWQRLVHPEDLALAQTALARHFDGTTAVYECELRMQHRDGRWIWVLSRGQVSDRLPDGTPGWMYGTHQDISPRKLQERALAASEAMLARSATLANVGGWELDLPTQRLTLTDQTCHIHGLPPGTELPLEQAFEFFPPEVRPLLQAAMARGVSEGQPWDMEVPFDRADGHRIWVRAMGQAVLQDGQAVRLVGALQDVTARREGEVALAAARRDLQNILDALPSLVGYWTRDLHCTFGNKALREWWQVPAEQLVGMALETLIGPEVLAANRPMIDAVLAGQDQSFERDLRGPDGLIHPSLIRYIADRRDGEVPGFYVLISDVSSIKHAQAALEQLNQTLVERTAQAESASAAKSDFLANTSHEIRTPLNAILGLTYLLLHQGLSADSHRLVEQIQLAGRSLLSLVSEVLDLAKIEAGQLELIQQPFVLQVLLQELREMHLAQARSKGLSYKVTSAPQLAPVWTGDAQRIRQVLDNLVSNAIKFSHTGSVAVHVEPAGETEGLKFEVSDTGIGMAPATVQRLFQPFTQADTSVSRRYGGTGLGLSIVARLTTLMEGQVSAHSVPGEGSRFVVVLPLQPDNHLTPPTAGHGNTAVRVLVADDDPLQRDGLVRLGQSLGWAVDAVGGGLTMVDRAVAAALLGQPFEAVVTDWDMPDLDGLSAIARLHERLDGAPPPAAVVVSVHDIDKLRASAHAELADALLVKPVLASTLFNAVNGAVGKRAGARQRLLDASRVESSESIWLHGVRVLVVDDSSINLEVAQRVLELELADVECSPSGEDALAKLQQAPERYDIVLLDIQMSGLDGIEVLRRMRCQPELAQLPVVALTAGVQPRERDDAMAAGAHDFLSKPLEPARLIRCLRRHVEDRRGAPLPVLQRKVVPTTLITELGVPGVDENTITPSLRQDRPLYLSMLKRFIDEFGSVLATPEQELPARLHKLRGSAWVVGAGAAGEAAQQLESALREPRRSALPRLRLALQDILDTLARDTQGILAQEAARLAELEKAGQAASSPPAGPLDTDRLRVLARLVDRQSLDAMKCMAELEPTLRGALPVDEIKALRTALAEFDFQRARGLLANWLA